MEGKIIQGRRLLHCCAQKEMFAVLQPEQSHRLPISQDVWEHPSGVPGETCLSTVQHPPELSLETASGSHNALFDQQKNTRNLSSQEGMIKGMSFGQGVEMDQTCTFARFAGCWAGEGREGSLRNRVCLELLLNSFFNTAFSIISYPLDTPPK